MRNAAEKILLKSLNDKPDEVLVIGVYGGNIRMDSHAASWTTIASFQAVLQNFLLEALKKGVLHENKST